MKSEARQSIFFRTKFSISLMAVFPSVLRAGPVNWQEDVSHGGTSGSGVSGLLLAAVVCYAIAWLRRYSEKVAFGLMCAFVVVGAWTATAQIGKPLVFPLLVIGFGFWAVVFWSFSDFFRGQ